MDFDLSSIFPGMDPAQAQSIAASLMPSEEERRRARRDGFLQAGFAMLANPYRGQELQSLGNAGSFGMQAYRGSLDDQMKQRQQALTQAAMVQKANKEAQTQQLINAALKLRSLRGGAPAGMPAPAAQAGAGGAQAPGMPPTPIGGAAPSPAAAGAVGNGPAPMPGGNDGDLELLLAAVGKKDMADVLHRQGQITQGPMGTLMKDGQLVGQITQGGVLWYDGTPGGRFEGTNPAALKAQADQAGATKRAEAGAQAEFDLVQVPDGRGGTISMPRSEAIARTRGAPAGQPSAPPLAGDGRVTINLKDASREEATALLQQLLGQGGAAPAPGGGVGYDPGPVAQHRATAAIDTAAAGERKAADLAMGQIDKSYETANAAATGIANIHEARRALDSGKVISGAGADFRLNFGRALSLAGNGDAKEQVAATQTYASTMARQVLTIIKNLGSGSGISDADRDYAAKIEGGQIALDETSMRRLLDISERASRAAIGTHNQRASTGSETFQNPRLREFYTIKEPGQYTAPKRMPQLASAARGNQTAQAALRAAIEAGDEETIERLRRKGYVQ